MELPSRSLILAIFLAVGLLQQCLPSMAEPSGDFISEICYDTRNITFCEEFLRSYPKLPGGYTHEVLCKFTLYALIGAAKSTWNLIDSLLKNETDSRIRVQLDECLGDYKLTIGLIREACKLILDRDYKSLKWKADDIVDAEFKCEKGFNDTGLDEPIQLTDASNWSQNLGSIMVALAKRLNWNKRY